MIMGIVYKSSKMGWSQNQRLLYVDKNCLSYYSKVPSDLNEELMKSAEVIQKRKKPKMSIAIEFLSSIDVVDDADRKKLKKKFSDGFAAFKVTFDVGGILNGELVKTDPNVIPTEQN